MTMIAPVLRQNEVRRLQRWSLLVGVAAAALCTLGAFYSPLQFFRAYLVAFLFFLGIAHGCLAVLMLYHLTGGAWGFLIRRVLEAGMGTMPLFAVLFLPFIIGAPYLYEWTQPEIVAASRSLQHKQFYLNLPFFWARAGLYFAIWITCAFLLRHWSRRQDETADPVFARSMTSLSGPGLVLFGITITFASIDWVMSLQTAFRSTIFGPLFASGEVLTGQAVALVVLAWLVLRPPFADAVSPQAVNDLGSLLFTFLVIWAYMELFQFLLIWMANLRYDIIWYLPRSRDGWEWVAWTLVLFHFTVPFFLLLVRAIKRDPAVLAALAGLILLMHLLFLYYQVLPAFPDGGIADHWMDLLTPLAVGGVWLAYFLWNISRLPLLPLHDAQEQAALHLVEVAAEEEEHPGDLRHA